MNWSAVDPAICVTSFYQKKKICPCIPWDLKSKGVALSLLGDWMLCKAIWCIFGNILKQVWKFAFNPQNLAIFLGKHLLKNIL